MMTQKVTRIKYLNHSTILFVEEKVSLGLSHSGGGCYQTFIENKERLGNQQKNSSFLSSYLLRAAVGMALLLLIFRLLLVSRRFVNEFKFEKLFEPWPWKTFSPGVNIKLSGENVTLLGFVLYPFESN